VSDAEPLLLAWYGDDFSGSTDVLEVLAKAGVRAVLFPGIPTAAHLARYPGVQAVGIAGVSRSLPISMMDAELTPAFAALRELRPRLVHYKVCSTFDSSPEVGSIGRALLLGQEVFRSAWVPALVGAPALGRYCAFGNLFARSGPGTPVYRLDRHPTMSRHPVTPMYESDLTLLLAAQTGRPVGLIDWLTLRASPEAVNEALAYLRQAGVAAVVLDILDDRDLPGLGRLLWEGEAPTFAVGSSGVEYALTAHWTEQGALPAVPPCPGFGPVSQALVVCGSCSPVTAAQVAVARDNGFAEVALHPEDWIDEGRGAAGQAFALLSAGRSVVVHAACGPDDPRIAAVRDLLAASGRGAERDRLLGRALAAVVRAAVGQLGLRRVAVAGGDTSGYVTRELGIEALEFVAPLAPGSPLCRARAPGGGPLDGLEITFKGGQVGTPDFFVRVLRGTPSA
jgi:3-oxoisoapionate kinase